MKRSPWTYLSIVCLFFALIPLFCYRIANTGVLLLLFCSILLLAYAKFQKALSPFLKKLFYVAVSLAFLFGGVLSVAMAWHAWLNQPPPAGPDAVIVLGCKINGTQPSKMLRRRLDVAAEYLLAHPDVICVVSGGQGADEVCPEAVVMANELMEAGIAPDRILLEQNSSSTQENIAFSCDLLRSEGYAVQHITIVTDSFHQMRAAVYARRGGLLVSGISSSAPWGLFPSYWVREWPGILKAWLIDDVAGLAST